MNLRPRIIEIRQANVLSKQESINVELFTIDLKRGCPLWVGISTLFIASP